MLLKLLILALSVVLAASTTVPDDAAKHKPHKKSHSHHHHRRHHATLPFELKGNQRVIVDAGYYSFNFGASFVTVRESFTFHSKRLTTLTVFDCYCNGDQFQVYDTNLEIITTSVPTSIDNSCQGYSDDPYWCQIFGGDQWSNGNAQLNPGFHNITILPLSSPYGKGTGFLRVDTLCQNGSYLQSCCTLYGNCKNGIVN